KTKQTQQQPHTPHKTCSTQNHHQAQHGIKNMTHYRDLKQHTHSDSSSSPGEEASSGSARRTLFEAIFQVKPRIRDPGLMTAAMEFLRP
ncbi:hypothetical protein, partial [Actinomyces bowdenii]|uniref:hypothetical protein n=1 Tax=Actinomyces bowdenii TaxID=131109 RepID=UPI001C54FBB8